jgi:hypothetical protein
MFSFFNRGKDTAISFNCGTQSSGPNYEKISSSRTVQRILGQVGIRVFPAEDLQDMGFMLGSVPDSEPDPDSD